MTISGFWPTFLVGCIGGIMGETIGWYMRRESPHIQNYLKGARYWITTILMILIGGVLAILYGIESKSAILILHIGISAPIIIKILAQIPSEGALRDITKRPSVHDFIAGH